MAAAISALLSRVFPPSPGQTEDNALELKAVPGLTTFLDQALFRSNEGQLTATICSSHALLTCWLDTKRQSQLLLDALEFHDEESSIRTLCESFARQCLDCSMDAIERLGTDRFAQSANVTDPYDSLSSPGGAHHSTGNVFHGVGQQGIATGILDSKEEISRRAPMQRRGECWESPRLFCPDHVWADDAYSACQRWIRNLTKHPFVVKEADVLSPLATSGHKDDGSTASSKRVLSGSSQRQASLLIQLFQDDLPIRLFHFKQAMEADAVVTKRLYLVKSEYRAPFRAFLEAHQTLLRAPPMEIVQACLKSPSRSKSEDPGKELQTLLKTPALVEVLALEREMEQLEQSIGQALYPFTELARTLDQRKARLKVIPEVLEESQMMPLQKTLRRLKGILCRKGAYGMSTGIRPILLDLQNFPRDDEIPRSSDIITKENLKSNIDDFVGKLDCLSNLVKRKNGFAVVKVTRQQNQQQQPQPQDYPVDFPAAIVKGCTESFDMELLQCQLVDWFAMVERQHVLQRDNDGLPDQIRQAEMATSIAGAQEQSLKLVEERLEKMQSDRQLRFDVLKELLEDLCLREMNIYVNVTSPNPTQSLVLKQTSALGFLGVPLQLAGELLPLG